MGGKQAQAANVRNGWEVDVRGFLPFPDQICVTLHAISRLVELAVRGAPNPPLKGQDMDILTRPPVDPAISLVQAMVVTSDTPLLLLDGDLTVIAASASFCHAFALDPTLVAGRPIFAMGTGEWDLPRMKSLLTATVSGGAEVEKYEMDLEARDGRGVRCLELSAHKLDYADQDNVRLLLSVADRTETKAAEKDRDALVAEKVLLIQELQHRVANSLQIIASVLMQSARRVGSEEVRSHLRMARNRVMSIASIQKQLAVTGATEVALKPYFTQLCRSIGASMIGDPENLTILVEVDDTSVHSDTSVSLGLIVTELVINCLKHAFPDDRAGTIRVSYTTNAADWTMSVDDDGIGMPAKTADAKAGLGTSIVEALTRQLRARIVLADAKPGTSVSIIHEGTETIGADVLPMVRAV